MFDTATLDRINAHNLSCLVNGYSDTDLPELAGLTPDQQAALELACAARAVEHYGQPLEWEAKEALITLRGSWVPSRR